MQPASSLHTHAAIPSAAQPPSAAQRLKALNDTLMRIESILASAASRLDYQCTQTGKDAGASGGNIFALLERAQLAAQTAEGLANTINNRL